LFSAGKKCEWLAGSVKNVYSYILDKSFVTIYNIQKKITQT